ncbi:hypothetical protein Hypma_001408 [Hypsizygus marmoreus]|uniref:Uncharacterized protein n=1 Tax=Hypsizygus marmoreus TaxID=39966 RepID=A0A369K2E6_HYPMA|nr:hypothetical protein Hypma_001408 [Hypsizygus marmoreus]
MSFSFYQRIPGGFVFGSPQGDAMNQDQNVQTEHGTEQIRPDVEMTAPGATLTNSQNFQTTADHDFDMGVPVTTDGPANKRALQSDAGQATASEHPHGDTADHVVTRPTLAGSEYKATVEHDVDMTHLPSSRVANDQPTMAYSAESDAPTNSLLRETPTRESSLFVTPPGSPLFDEEDNIATFPDADFEMNTQTRPPTTGGPEDTIEFQPGAGPTMSDSLPQNDLVQKAIAQSVGQNDGTGIPSEHDVEMTPRARTTAIGRPNNIPLPLPDVNVDPLPYPDRHLTTIPHKTTRHKPNDTTSQQQHEITDTKGDHEQGRSRIPI